MRNIKILTVLFGLLALFSGVYTLPAKEQKYDNKEVKAHMDLLAEVQNDENESDGYPSALQTEDDEGHEQEDDDGNIIFALLQLGDDGAVTQEDSNEADTQKWFKIIFRGIRHIRRICKVFNRYSRTMQAEMQNADDGDEELAKNFLKRVANAQEDDAEAQFFKRLFRKIRKAWHRGKRFFKKKVFKKIRKIWRRGRRFFKKKFFKNIRRGVGRFCHCYRNIRKCIRRHG